MGYNPERPPFWKCTKSNSPHFTVGTAYEVLRYHGETAEICTDNPKRYIKLPHPSASFLPHDPWANHRSHRKD